MLNEDQDTVLPSGPEPMPTEALVHHAAFIAEVMEKLGERWTLRPEDLP